MKNRTKIPGVDSAGASKAVENSKIWTKEYILMMAANFFIAVNFYAHLSTGAIIAIEGLGETESRGGFAAGIFVVGSLIARVVVSRYVSQKYFRRAIFIGMFASLVFSALLYNANNFALFCVLRFVCGMTFGVNNNLIYSAVTLIIPVNKRGEGLGWFSLSQILGIAIGPFLGVSVFHQYGPGSVSIIATLAVAAALVLYGFVGKTQKSIAKEPGQQKEPEGTAHTPGPKERGVWQFFEFTAIRIAILCFIIYVSNSNFMAFAAAAVTEAGAANLSSVVFLAYAAGMLALRPFVGKIYDKKGPNQILAFAFISLSAGLFLVGLGHVPLILPAAVLVGFGLTSQQGATLPIVVTNAPSHRIAVANATYFLSFDLGAAIGPIIGGRIVEHAGFTTMFTVCAIIAIACLPLYFGVLAKRRP